MRAQQFSIISTWCITFKRIITQDTPPVLGMNRNILKIYFKDILRNQWDYLQLILTLITSWFQLISNLILKSLFMLYGKCSGSHCSALCCPSPVEGSGKQRCGERKFLTYLNLNIFLDFNQFFLLYYKQKLEMQMLTKLLPANSGEN